MQGRGEQRDIGLRDSLDSLGERMYLCVLQDSTHFIDYSSSFGLVFKDFPDSL